jgi:hypothetical protein
MVNLGYQDVVDDQVIGIQALELSIGLCVLQEVEEELGRLLRPTANGGSVDFGLQTSEHSLTLRY